MSAVHRLDRDQAARLVARYAAEWQANVRSTERADRPRAEAAIRSLYLGARLQAPRVQWVPSPKAGMTAAGFAGTSRRLDPRRVHPGRRRIGRQSRVERPREPVRHRPQVAIPTRGAGSRIELPVGSSAARTRWESSGRLGWSR